ncbi:MAG: hypothetical protein ACRDO0_18730 [Nocardioidaceae bacterium]
MPALPSLRPTRRSVVAAAIAVPVAAAGCTLSGPTPTRSPQRRSAEVDPDVALLDDAAAATTAMVELYEGVLREHPSLRGDLRPMLAAQRAHADALGEAAPQEKGRPSGPSDGAGPRRRGGQRVEVPRRPAAAIRALTEAESRSATDLLEATRKALSGPFAQLLASMSASASQRVLVLGEVDAQ